jgi:uncharacterized protein YndB with AHSA1/START domain
MATPQKDFTLEVRRTFPASREKVFAAWADPQKLAQWMCQDVPTHQVTYRELNIRTGGRYVMEIHDSANGQIYIGSGIYRAVTPPRKLIFTWSWVTQAPDGTSSPFHEEPETLVTVDFFERNAATEVVLKHEGFVSQKAHDEHDGGWNGCFNVLAALLEQRS